MRATIFREFTFEAAHRLTQVPENHKCARLHGHSYRVEVHVEGPVDTKSGWVMDFAEIKRAWSYVEPTLDHNYLNDVMGLDNPTSEVLSRWLWGALKSHLPGLCRVVVRETCTSGCSYSGEE